MTPHLPRVAEHEAFASSASIPGTNLQMLVEANLAARGIPFQEATVKFPNMNEARYGALIALSPGRWSFSVGLDSLNLKSPHFFFGNNAIELQGNPLHLDVDHRAVRRLSLELGNRLLRQGFDPLAQTAQNIYSLVCTLNSVLQNNLSKSYDDQNVRSLSEIVMGRNTACAGYCLVGGVILHEALARLDLMQAPLSVQFVHGHIGSVDEISRGAFGHVWLRIELGRARALYDPFFSEPDRPLSAVKDHSGLLSGNLDRFSGRTLQHDSLFSLVKNGADVIGPQVQSVYNSLGAQLYIQSKGDCLAPQFQGVNDYIIQFRQPTDLLVIDGAISLLRRGDSTCTWVDYPVVNIHRLN